MKPTHVAITEGAAELLASSAENLNAPPFISDLTGSLRFQVDGACGIVWSSQDRPGARYALVICSEIDSFPPGTDASEVFARIFRALRATGKFPIRLPISWSEYHFKSLIAFFAVPRSTADSIRWIAEVDESQRALNFHKLTAPGRTQDLEKFQIPDTPKLRDIVDCVINSAASSAPPKPAGLVDRVDFEAIGSAAIAKAKTFEEWRSLLNAKQSEILNLPLRTSVRIVGPAGSGKTLTLCLRAIQEIRSAAHSGRSIRVLFATHSWAMAERIDDTLVFLNSGQPVPAITVYPLLQILNDLVGGSMLKGLRVLGDDSTEGRRLQIAYLSESLQAVSPMDRAVLDTQGLSQLTLAALDGDASSQSELLEYLYEEINGVLLADGLIPGDRRKEEEYLSRPRSDDLPPFPTRGDRGLVLLIYKDFLSRLREREFITTDQLVSDATKVLETFAWGVKRESEGFDLILIDELQLFDAQERFAVALLASSFDSTAFITAEDPSQGLYSAILPGWQKDVPSRNERRSIELSAPVRFTPGILAFIYRLYLAFPLNAQGINVEEVESHEGRPRLIREVSSEAAEERVCSIVRDTVSSMDSDSRAAVISLDGNASKIANRMRASGVQNVVEVLSLDDVDKLSYSRRSVVVGEWQFLGGTQFSHVIVVASHGSRANSTFARVRELTALYVAASRAARWLCLIIGGDVHPEVQNAVDEGVLHNG